MFCIIIVILIAISALDGIILQGLKRLNGMKDKWLSNMLLPLTQYGVTKGRP